MLDISVLIVSHGHEQELPDCVNSLLAANQGLDFEVLVLDNLGGKSKNWISAILVDRLTTSLNASPRGFASNVNSLAKEAKGEYLLLLNPDTSHLSGCTAQLVELTRKNRGIAVVGCKLVNSDLTPQRSYRRFPTVPILACRAMGADGWQYRPSFYRHRLMENETLSESAPVDWVFGAFMLIERQRFIEIGCMDDRFRMYYEDVDLCYRFRQAGLATVYDPSVVFIHRHARDSAKRIFSQLRRWHLSSGIRFFLKHRYVLRPPVTQANGFTA